jgi:hypothetical protein
MTNDPRGARSGTIIYKLDLVASLRITQDDLDEAGGDMEQAAQNVCGGCGFQIVRIDDYWEEFER